MMDAESEGVQASMEAAQGAEEKVRAIMEAAPVPMVVTRASDGVVLYANSRVGPTFGVSSDDVVGRPAADFYTDGPSHEELLARLGESGGYVRDLEVSARKVDGTPAWVIASIQEMEYGGEPALLSAIHDVTERKQMEDELRESEERYRMIVESVEEVIYVVSLTDDPFHGSIDFVSARAKDILGYEPDEFQRDPGLWFRIVHPEDRESVIENTRKILASGSPGTRVYRVQHKERGTFVWLEDAVAPQTYEGGKVTVFRGVARDITERKRAEEALRESETMFRTLAETMPAIVGIFQGGHIRYLSRAAEAATGYSCEELLAMDFSEVIHPDYRDLVRERGLARRRGDQVPQGYEVKIVTKGGEERWLALAGAAIEFEGKPAEVATALDITDRKQMEAELQKVRETLDSTTERQMQRGNLHGLTFREMTVLNLITEGKADKEIAMILGISFLTARKHTANILSKMGVASRTQAAVEAVRQGLLG